MDEEDMQLVEKDDSQQQGTYSLYETLSKYPTGEITQENLEEIKRASASFNQEQSCAFYMLICEHAKQTEVFDPASLPYSITYQNKKVTIELKTLPPELQEILFKFINVLEDKV
jgi:hypothetical protein